MPNNCLSVLYKHVIQVENKNVGLKVGGTNILLPKPPPPTHTHTKKTWGTRIYRGPTSLQIYFCLSSFFSIIRTQLYICSSNCEMAKQT